MNAKAESIHKVFVLLSGGIDSTTTLAIASNEFDGASFEALSFNYGQRHVREMEAAKQVCNHYNIPLQRFSLSGLLDGMLVDKGTENEQIPEVDYADLPHGISPTYVSFRNGTMLSVAAAHAQKWVMHAEKAGYAAEATIYCGVHADDGVNWAYPDCTPEFIGAMANAIHIGTYNKVRLRAPLLFMNKAGVVHMGALLNAPLELTWSCYKGEEVHCGVCPTCRSRHQAFLDNGLDDPTTYNVTNKLRLGIKN